MDDNREARYAEAIDNLTFASKPTDAAWLDEVTDAVVAVADAELVEGREFWAGQLAKTHRRAESAEAALASEREAHAGLRARLEAWASNARTHMHVGTHDECFTCTNFAALDAVLAAPVAAEEGDEHEVGEAWPFSLRSAASLIARCAWVNERQENQDQWSPRLIDEPEIRTTTAAHARRRFESALAALNAAPSGSDEQGNRPATPDANGVHDTKGGEAVHLVARDASDAPLARTFCGVATNGTGVRHTASLSIVNCAACLAGLCHADVEDDER